MKKYIWKNKFHNKKAGGILKYTACFFTYSIAFIIFSAIRFITGTETELPDCFYLLAFLMSSGNENISGNPWNPTHSSGVSFLIP